MCMYVGGCPFTVGGEEGRRKGLKNSREMAIARALQISRKTGVGGWSWSDGLGQSQALSGRLQGISGH